MAISFADAPRIVDTDVHDEAHLDTEIERYDAHLAEVVRDGGSLAGKKH